MSNENVQTFRDSVLELLDYNPETGIFTWRTHKQKARVGKVAGWVDNTGYVRIGLDGKKYSSHRLAWLIMTGKNPIFEIDHVDNNRANNVFSNLREATHPENNQNKGIKSNNTSGYIGVTWDKARSKWKASARKDNVTFNIGRFDNPKEAAIARDKVVIKLHGEFSRLNFKYVVDEEGNIELDE